MKKIYQNPEIKIFAISTDVILAGGSNDNAVEFSGDGGSAGLNSGTASGGAYSRRGSLWDDEDDEY